MTERLGKVVVPLLSFVFTALALSFVGQRVWVERSSLLDALSGAKPIPLVVGAVLAVFAMTWIAIVWKWVLGRLGASVGYSSAVPAYFLGELGKYIPGGLWPILGRGELIRREGVGRQIAYPSVLLSLALLYISAAVFSVVAMPVAGVVGRATPLLYLGVVGCAVGGTLILHPRVLGAVRSRIPLVALQNFRTLPWRGVCELVLVYVPTWIAVGAATASIAVAISDDVNIVQVAVAAVVSWLVGFVIFPVPGGLGVRETVLVVLAGLEEAEGLTVALVARFLFVLVDVGGFLASLIVGKLRG